MVSLSRFINHLDFFSIYQWLSGSFVRLSLTVLLIADMFHLRKNRAKPIFLICAFMLLVILSLIPLNDNTFLFWMKTYIYPGMFALELLVTAFLLCLAYWAMLRRNEVKQ